MQHCRYCRRALKVGVICTCIAIVAADAVERSFGHLDRPHANVVEPYLNPDQAHDHAEQEPPQTARSYPAGQSGSQYAGLGWQAQWSDPPRRPLNRAIFEPASSWVPRPPDQDIRGVSWQADWQPPPRARLNLAALEPASSFVP